MGAGGRADAPTTTGKLKYELVDGQTTATYVYATYPLKFLHPRGTIRQGFGTYVTVRRPSTVVYPLGALSEVLTAACVAQYILGYGGGLVGGDNVSVDCELAPEATGAFSSPNFIPK